ncbi:MAG: PadR family transcriptional regulator [Candidatus Bathyarchaeota archaeon]|nr:PadR family transcriptional regulator [Candidatus Bathyarchaeota archaeon]MDT8782949.1 PadR family transcriptional regulator [Candidatus Bathyarchaeota archaeon]
MVEEKELQHRKHQHRIMHHRNWFRHNAMVPKGFLRYHVLEALSEKPLSGSELIEEIHHQTGGHWKPSPGSIYPLLAWLQDNAHIKELPTENGLKRYELTQNGKSLLKDQIKARERFHEDIGCMSHPFFDRFFRNLPQEKTNTIRSSMKRLLVASISLGKTLKENFSDKDLDEALAVLDEASEKLEKINLKLKGDVV